MRTTLRRRLFVAFVLLASGVLLLASAATWLLVRGSAHRIARDELRDKAARIQDLTADLNEQLLASDLGNSGRLGGRRNAADAARLQGSLVQIVRGLQVTDTRLIFVAPTTICEASSIACRC